MSARSRFPAIGEEALAIYEAAGPQYGLQIADVLVNLAQAFSGAVLASVYDAQQRFDEAVPLYVESVRVLEAEIGRDHDQTLSTKNNLAEAYYLMGRLDKAAAMHREILASRRRNAGTDLDPSLATSLQNLAAALKNQGRLREADSPPHRM